MSAEKHQQLMDEGKLNPDGSIKQDCPYCGQPLPEGFVFPSAEPAEGDAVADAEAVAVDTATPGQEG